MMRHCYPIICELERHLYVGIRTNFAALDQTLAIAIVHHQVQVEITHQLLGL